MLVERLTHSLAEQLCFRVKIPKQLGLCHVGFARNRGCSGPCKAGGREFVSRGTQDAVHVIFGRSAARLAIRHRRDRLSLRALAQTVASASTFLIASSHGSGYYHVR